MLRLIGIFDRVRRQRDTIMKCYIHWAIAGTPIDSNSGSFQWLTVFGIWHR